MKLRPIDKMWVGGGIAAGVVILALGWFFLISPQKSQTSDFQSQTNQSEQRNAQLQAKLITLGQQSKNLDQFKATLTRDQQALPSSSGLPDFLRSIQSLGGQNQVSITSVIIGAPAPLVAAAPVAAATPTATASTAATTGTPATAASTGSVYTIAVTLNAGGTSPALLAFLNQLQHVQPRAVLIDQASLKPADATGQKVTAAGQTTLVLSMDLFVQTGQ